MSRTRRSVTLKEVAAEAGVSMMTVSAALRAQSTDKYPVAESTRERVHAAARKLRYFPSAVAQGMRGQRLNAIGVVLINPDARLQGDPYVCGLLDGIIAVANTEGQNTTLFTGRRWSSAAESLPIFCDGRTDGLIILSPSPDSDIVPALLEAGLPFVLISGQSDDPRVSSVDVDHITPVETLVNHLLELGHRRIAFLPGRAESRSARMRHEGYRNALEKAGIPYDPALVLPGYYSIASGVQRAEMLLALPAATCPTALCCGNDQIAAGALQALSKAGVRVPEEMSVTGFDDSPEAASVVPPLTTVRQPLEEMGRRAARLLLDAIESGFPIGERELLPTEIVYRRSAAPPLVPPKETS
ncbi:MAG: LacI family DNA-binding transcriptional regulator [Armatimonadota bacterium]